MAATGWPKFLLKMQESDKYKDLILECGKGQIVKINSAIACVQSPVIARAIMPSSKEFKEPKSKTFYIRESDADAVGHLVQFMYTGNYNVNDQGLSDTTNVSVAVMLRCNVKTLACHINVIKLADKLQITDLTELSTAKIIELLEKHWSAELFCFLAQAVSKETHCQALSKAVGVLAATHIEELVDQVWFGRLEILNSFALEALQKCAIRVKEETGNRKKATKWAWKT
ncbi:hypothetical protein E4U55_007379 [Claviceps digitariae]|nr:hypothetical protein E4U55_007379 [Claviceps digitariae]